MRISRKVHKAKHMSLHVEGCLRNHVKKKITYFEHDDGTLMTDKEARARLYQAKAEGKRVLPMGDCYRFDYQKGCPGHIKSLMPTDAKMEEINAELPNCKNYKLLPYCTNEDVKKVQLRTKKNVYDGEITYACAECRRGIMNGSHKIVRDADIPA